MKLLKVLPFVAMLTLGATSVPTSAEVVGGWDEEKGYFSYYNEESSDTQLMTRNVATVYSSPSHSAQISYNSTGKERVTGSTTWRDVYHYTRARYEWPNGSVESDSKRVYGTSKTTATSGWNSGDFVTAKTYYGSN